MSEISNEKIARVRYRCRRGMLELDSLLQNFFEQKYLVLSKNDQVLFEELLECSDQDLYHWFLGQKKTSSQFANIIEQILFFNTNQKSYVKKLYFKH
jgi:antitoxin CptB